MLETVASIDRSLFLFLNTCFAHPLLDILFKNSTEARFWIVPGLAAAAFFIVKKKKQALVILGISIVLVAITDSFAARVLKPLFERPRPCHPEFLIEGARFLSGMKKSFSMPSVHAVNIFAQAMMLSMFFPRWTPVYFTFALFIGFSRIYVGVHYPGDVLVGALVGILIAMTIVIAYRKIEYMIRRRKAPAPVH